MKTFVKHILLFSMCALLGTLSSCFRLPKGILPSENTITQEYDLEGFSGICASNKIVVHYNEGADYSVRAEGPENMVKSLTCNVDKDQVLTLDLKKGKRFKIQFDSEKVHLWITSPKLNRFSATMAAQIKCDTLTDMPYLSVETFNAGAFVCDSLSGGNITINAQNASSVTLRCCQADILTASAFNASSIHMSGRVENMISLEAQNASQISFTGSATTVNAEAFNAANIQLEGEFQTKTLSQSNLAHITIDNKQIDF